MSAARGGQNELFNADSSDIDEELPITGDGHYEEYVGQRPTETDTNVGQRPTVTTDSGSGGSSTPTPTVPSGRESTEDISSLIDENTRLKIDLAKLEEQAKTKDEMVDFFRKEIDRRGGQITDDRETYTKSLEWYRAQIEAKDAALQRLHTEMRGLLEAPKAAQQGGEVTAERVESGYGDRQEEQPDGGESSHPGTADTNAEYVGRGRLQQ